MNSEAGIFTLGPTGRATQVTASGQLEVTEGGPLLPFGFGDTGRAVGVDANGRLGVSLASPLQVNNSPSASGSIDLGVAKQFDIILDKSIVISSFLHPTEGAKYLFVLQQDGAGSHTVGWPTNVKWAGGSPPTLTTTPSGIDVISMVYRGRNSTFLADIGKNFA